MNNKQIVQSTFSVDNLVYDPRIIKARPHIPVFDGNSKCACSRQRCYLFHSLLRFRVEANSFERGEKT